MGILSTIGRGILNTIAYKKEECERAEAEAMRLDDATLMSRFKNSEMGPKKYGYAKEAERRGLLTIKR